MVDVVAPHTAIRPKLDGERNWLTIIIFLSLFSGGLFYTADSLFDDIARTDTPITTWLPFLLLGVALLIALAFEFVNGFHDTANAVATVTACSKAQDRDWC